MKTRRGYTGGPPSATEVPCLCVSPPVKSVTGAQPRPFLFLPSLTRGKEELNLFLKLGRRWEDQVCLPCRHRSRPTYWMGQYVYTRPQLVTGFESGSWRGHLKWHQCPALVPSVPLQDSVSLRHRLDGNELVFPMPGVRDRLVQLHS